jgi:hypothetical protein
MWFLKPWMDAAKFNLEIQSVVSMRLMKIAAGGAEAAAEYVRMIQEKSTAAVAAQTAGSLAKPASEAGERSREAFSLPRRSHAQGRAHAVELDRPRVTRAPFASPH